MLALVLAASLFQSPALPGLLIPFHGRVVRVEDGAPIAGARAEVRWNRSSTYVSRSHGTPRHEIVPPPPFPAVKTGADGRFRIDVDPTISAWIVVAAPGRGTGACGLLAGHHDTSRAAEFALTRAARLELHVHVEGIVASETPRVTASVEAPLYASSVPAWLGVIADDIPREFAADLSRDFELGRPEFASGEPRFKPFVLEGLPAGVPLEIAVAYGGRPIELREPKRIVLAPGETRSMTWPPSPLGPGHLRVDVRDENGSVLAGAPVLIGRARGGRAADMDGAKALRLSTNALGTARSIGLPLGRRVVDLGGDLCAEAIGVDVSGDEETVVTLRAEPARVIEGRLVDSTGAPVANAWVSFARERDADASEVHARTSADGTFVLRGVPRDVHGVLQAHHPVVADLEVEHPESGANGAVEIRFPAVVALRVRSLDAAGAPLSAQLRYGPSYALGALWCGAESAEHELALPPGPRRITALTTDGRAASAVVDVGRVADLELRLAPAGSVRLRHRGVAELLDVTLEDERGLALGVATLISGVDEVVLVPPGEWEVNAANRGRRAIRVAAGVETLLEL